MEQVKIGQDTREYNRIISELSDRAKKVYQPLIDQYHTLNISILTTVDLDVFFNSPKSFFVTLLTKDEPLTLGGVKLQAEKVYEFMERPTGLDAFVEKLINYKIEAQNKSSNREFLGNLEYYEIVDNKLQITENYKDEIEDLTTYYAKTENQLNAYNLITDIISKIEDFNKLWNETSLTLEADRLITIGYSSENKNKMYLNVDQLLRYTK